MPTPDTKEATEEELRDALTTLYQDYPNRTEAYDLLESAITELIQKREKVVPLEDEIRTLVE